MTDGVPALHAAMAAELDRVKAGLEQAAIVLCLDSDVVSRHAEALQCFDRLAQVVSEIADLLRSPADPELALGAIRLEALRNRLTRACATPH